MPDWLWVIFLFLALTVGYLTGFVAGVWRSDHAPTENAYIREAELNTEAYKEVELRKAALEQETEKRKMELDAQNDLEKFRMVEARDRQEQKEAD